MTRKKSADVAQKIKIFMLENGISQRDLAKKLKVAPQTVSQFLGGKYDLRTDTLEKIGKALGTPANYFFAEVRGSAVGANAKVTAATDVEKDIKLLSVQVELLTAKIKLLEEEIKKIKRNNYLYDAKPEG